MMKQCRRCEQNLPLSSFRAGSRSPRICIACLQPLITGEASFTMNATEAVNFMARLEAGEAIRTLAGGGASSICSKEAFLKHCELYPAWGAKALALAKANSKSRILEGVFKRMVEGRTTCNNGHPLSEANIARMHETRKWDHRWCETCVRRWRGVGRYLAEDAGVIEPPQIEAPLSLSKGSRFVTADDVELIEEWLNKGVSLRKLLSYYDIWRLKLYRKNNPAWEAKFKPVIIRNSKLAVAIGSRKLRKTHCKYGHELTEENTHINAVSGFRACAACHRAFNGAPVTPQMIQNVERGLLTGMSFTDLTRSVGGSRSIISGKQLRNLRISRPDINERFALAARNPATVRSFASAGTVAPFKGSLASTSEDFVRNDIELYVPRDGDYEWLFSLTPRYLSRNARDIIVSDIFLELSERRVDRAGVPACAKRIIAAYSKDNPLKAYGDIRTPLPLDAPAYLDGTMSRVEIVSESLWA